MRYRRLIPYPTLRRAAAAALLLALPAASAQPQEPFFRVHHVAGKVHMLQAPGAGGNIGVFSGEDGVLLIDDRFERDVPALLEAVRSISDGDIRFVVNTHIHPDHIGGNNVLAALGVTILAHHNVRLRMLTDLRIPRRGGIYFDRPPAGARPVITYTEGISFFMNGEEVRVFLAPPAHTDGDSFVHFVESDVLHLGDVFRTNMYPIVDKYNGGSFLGMIEAMALAIEMAGPDTKVIPGHGEGFTDRAGMLEVHNLLLELRARTAALIAEGLTIEEILARNPTADLDPRWGQIPSWTATDLLPIIYEELQAQ